MTDEYLSGLLEGEGCFGMRTSGSPRQNGNTYRTTEISLGMTDADVVERVARAWGTTVTKSQRGPHLTLFRTRLTGVRAAAVMVGVFPLMGARRRSKIEECLTQWEHGHKPRWGWTRG